ncbi:MAG TPA: LPS export ABC transporter periplasmic protein LptC [Thermoanaerobaculia bacterium]|nr:LPS export ABC transporter periplasmic protein LptC [Thermoanaerobaculia bacterium]
MQRTIRILRVALPIVFFGFILLIALNWNRAKIQKDRSVTQPVTSTQRPSDKPQVESKTFEDTQTISGRLAARIRAQRVVAFQSGWNTLENVQLTIFRPNGLTYELVCPQAQFNSATKEADAKGGVRVTSSDNVDMTTAEIHFDGNRLTNHIPVQFRVDDWYGNAGALDLDVQNEQLRLYQKVDATTHPPDPAESPMNLKAEEGLFRRKEANVEFTKNVVMTRDFDKLVADRVVARFTPDRKSLLGVDGSGHVDITTFDDQAGSGKKEITCDHFWSENTGNEITAINAAGDNGAKAHAVIDGPPKRDLTASGIRVGMTNKQVTDVRANSGVVMHEFGEDPKEMTGDLLTVAFDPKAHRATSADIDGNFHYKDPKNTAAAVKANYDITGDRVILTATPGFDPTVTTEAQTLKAKLIEFSPKAGTAKATGSVIAQLVSKNDGPSADATTVFPANKPVFVNSDGLTMNQATKLAVFSGNVRAWQDTNTMLADEMQVHGMGDEIDARGHVRTTLYNTNTGEPRKTPMFANGDSLGAHKAERRIDLLGNVTIDDDTRHMSADKASFFFDANRKMERVEAQDKVTFSDTSTGRKGSGNRATYFVDKRLIFLYGSPATVSDPKGSTSGDQFAIDLARNKVESSQTKGTYKPQ